MTANLKLAKCAVEGVGFLVERATYCEPSSVRHDYQVREKVPPRVMPGNLVPLQVMMPDGDPSAIAIQ